MPGSSRTSCSTGRRSTPRTATRSSPSPGLWSHDPPMIAPTVLLVEDGPDLGPLLRDTMEEWEHRAILARTAAEALEVLGREPVSLILLDHELPDMSAPDLLKVLRSQRRQIPPVVLMTARQRPGTDGEWPELVDVLRKPFELSELAGVLERRLPRR